jgi:NAD(P)-dependent dehydrogenase (short-subunit alcohol dehydrogenase family)
VSAQATALILAADGASLGLADLNAAELGKVKAEVEALGAKAVTATVDVTNIQQVEDWVKKTHDTFGKLDGAVNAAGVSPGAGKRVHELSESDWAFVVVRDLARVELCEVLISTSQVMNSMRAELKYLTNGGSVVNIASTSDHFGEMLQTPYVASKHGVRNHESRRKGLWCAGEFQTLLGPFRTGKARALVLHFRAFV